ncbi:MAG: SIR2 family protein [Phycisphaerales bacterium]|jgi:hypothetical protein
MSDNVIILGAGASYDAGIPLMAGFVEKMWEFAVKKQVNGEPMSQVDIDIFQKAIDIKNELDSYHGRALFDDRNLEDILSILSFNEMNSSPNEESKLSLFTKAISRTIELSCHVKHNGENNIQKLSNSLYRTFWLNLFLFCKTHNEKVPSIISLNYDLVLERALFHLLIGGSLNSIKIPIQGIEVDYNYDPVGDFQYIIKNTTYDTGIGEQPGTMLKRGTVDNPLRIEILKLHGSLNFPETKTEESLSLVRPVDAPFILPPIISKMSSANSFTKMWATAIQRLRTAKNVIIVGYSLPRTDIYMQYFLKTALGPNRDLNRLYVFDPVLFKNDSTSKDMMDRYANCFSPQMKNSRIVFKPKALTDKIKGGSFLHFVNSLSQKYILF